MQFRRFGSQVTQRPCLLCLLAWWVVSACAFPQRVNAAEQWECRFLLTDQDAQFPEVRDIVEDQAGRIWAASWGSGVACITDTSWTSYTTANGLANDWVRALALGADGTVWISTPRGLCYVSDGVLKCIPNASMPCLGADEPDLIFMTCAGDLFITTVDGALIRVSGASKDASFLSKEPDRWKLVLSREAAQGVRVSDITEDEQGRLLLSFRDRTWALLDGMDLIRYPGQTGALQFTSSRDGSGKQTIWAGIEGDRDVLVMAEGTWQHYERMAAPIRELATGLDGTWYAGSVAGLYRNGAQGVECVDLGQRVGFPDINEVFFASDGSLWLGTREGLVRGAPQTWKNYRTSPEGRRIIGVVRDPAAPGQLLAIDDAHSVCRLEGDAWTGAVRLDRSEAMDRFFTAAGQPYLWALGEDRLYQFSISDGHLVSSCPTPTTGADRRLFMTSSGELWLTANDGVYALAGSHWEARPARKDYVRRTVNAIAEPEPGVFFVGARDGIERWDGEEITFFGERDGVAEDDAVYTICPTRGGDIWFGTFGSGAYVFNGEHFKRFDNKSGLAHHSISNIIEGADGAIWLSYRRVGMASYRDQRWLQFGYENGLGNAPIVQLLEGDSGLWVLSQNDGLYHYRPDRQAPDTRITAATEDVLHYGIGVFSFAASDAWQRTPAHALLYSWRVLDQRTRAELAPWSPFTSATSYITDVLEPGDYRLEVRASDDARNVDPVPAAVAFSVAVPFWRLPQVAIPAGGLLLICAVALIMGIRGHQALRHSEAALSQSNGQLMNEIRERLQAEKRLNDHFEQLEELVEGRTAELGAAQRALVEQERLATLGKVTASVSHELRNPLGTLRSTFFLIARKVQGHDLGLEDALARAERSIQRCDRIIEEFLDFTRTLAMDREKTIMDDWLRSVLQETPIPPAIHCEYTCSSAAELEVDPERLRRAVVNVINNAVQAMNEYDSEFKRLQVKSRVRGGRFEIVVKDNGPGISDENIARIFEPLYSTKGFGVGLGVPIVKDIMTKHGGGVEYHSVVGRGTTVVLWIPRGASALQIHDVLEDEPERSGEYNDAKHEAHNEEDDSKQVEQANPGEAEIIGLYKPHDREENAEE